MPPDQRNSTPAIGVFNASFALIVRTVLSEQYRYSSIGSPGYGYQMCINLQGERGYFAPCYVMLGYNVSLVDSAPQVAKGGIHNLHLKYRDRITFIKF